LLYPLTVFFLVDEYALTMIC